MTLTETLATDAGRRLRGLTMGEAAARLAQDGPNAVARPHPPRLLRRILAQLADPLVSLLLVAGAVTGLLGDWADTAIIVVVVVLNTAIGVAQQVRADDAVAALDTLTAPTARVTRDGAELVLPAADLARGDVVRVEAGDIVPADLLLYDAHRCQADEAALTGESVPVSRAAGDELSAGTVLVTGRAVGTVLRTGARSALGRIAELVANTHAGPTPLQRRLTRLSRVLGATAVGLCLVVFAVGLASGRPLLFMALTAVSLVVAAVPESLPAVVTLSLALGARRMARRRAIPRNLHAVETMGSVTVVASDKTGTMTEGRMTVRRAVAADVAVSVTGAGYDPAGRVDGIDRPLPRPLLDLARAGLLCSDAVVLAPTVDRPAWTAVGDPLEAALVTFAARCGLDPASTRASAPRWAEHPFDQATRQMTTVHRDGGAFLTICKGAPESVLAAPVIDPADPVVAATRQAAADLAAAGLRVLVIAAATTAEPTNPIAPTGLRPLGVIGIEDPLRPSAAATAAEFAQAGIRLMLITGDHPGTAAHIAAQVGIWRPGDPIATGDRPEQAHQVRVFARTQPEQKLDIIAELQHHGHVVAMTGDGVNDAPALSRADIGVAMGGGTEVARQAADLVLIDDNLGTVSHAVAEGRRVYDNIRRFLRYGLAGGTAELAVMLVGPLFGLGVPLLPGQILWINLLTHGLPGLALGAEPAEPDVLRRPPRPPDEQILGGGLLRDVLALGALLTTVTVGTGRYAAAAGWPWQSMVFVVLGLAQLGIALASRATRPRGTRWANPGLLAAVALSALAQLAAVAVPALRTLLGTAALDPTQLAVCAAAALLPGTLAAIWQTVHRCAGIGR
ncbi:cation-translocating P-type ATPase [Catellatospora tritici]|uniref:cation-translocating P-type ATPase n=1 Tax=Catellatospora tritici TaxID=2851566 RepID=UPI001C2DC1F4|nr:cation-translocating P-type ATPase [Catellatospora tritici]MBV1850481.1 cation-translocating P-type ATPase [Catellatospora tritici]